tara:strand:+ start:456 stop:719 length:264 start_codon:yes stop_codon:yes gene_type:complete
MTDEQYKENKERINNEVQEQIKRIENIITHFEETIESYTEKMLEIITDMEDNEPIENLQEYKDRIWQAYHLAMSWLIEEEEYDSVGM